MKTMKKILAFVLLFCATSVSAQGYDEIEMDSCVVDSCGITWVEYHPHVEMDSLQLAELERQERAELDSMMHLYFGDDVVIDLDNPDLEGILSQCENRTDLRVEALLILTGMKPQLAKQNGTDKDDLLMDTFTDMMKMIFEMKLFAVMGGEDNGIDVGYRQVISALSSSLFQEMDAVFQAQPEKCCEKLDEATEYLRRLDYIGDIYKEQTSFKPREEQPAAVAKIANEYVEDMKEQIMQIHKDTEWIRGFLFDVAKNGKKVDLKKYMSKELLKKMKKKDILSIITTKKPLDVKEKADMWNHSFVSQMGDDEYIVVIGTKVDGEWVSTEDDEDVRYVVKIAKENGQYIITDLRDKDHIYEPMEMDIEMPVVDLDTDN